jgi:acetyl-CoA/propionyl-CoA carboxylase biotin carboxyl carrier protein
MPGRVIKILVSAGDDVTPGQAVVVIEAMKMENEITAHRSGKVAELRVAEGASIASGDVIAVIK